MLSYSVSDGSTEVIWNFRLMPARARSVGVNAVMSVLMKETLPCVGTSAPAIHFISVLLPEPFGPIRPWNSFSPTVSAAPSSAVSLPKIFLMPAASRSGIALLLFGLLLVFLGLGTKTADPLALAEHKTDQAERPEQDHEQKQDRKSVV